MNTVITLDYEIYFGPRSGSAQRTLIEPTQALARLAQRHGVVLVFFVDTAYLLRLREAGARHAELRADLDAITRQLQALVAAGHELHLHVHPHWWDTPWNGQRWVMDLRRYRLHQFDDRQLAEIVAACAHELRQHGGATRGLAFRAGGWCLQPFQRLRAPLRAAGVQIDSTVFAGGLQTTAGAAFDFRQAPRDRSRWFFNDDPLQPQPQGEFLELPIASHRAAPSLYWQMAWSRLRRPPQHRPLGEGVAMAHSRRDQLRKLLWPSASVVSIDGLKAKLLPAAWRAQHRRGLEDFVVIGHTKALTPHALARLDDFLAQRGTASITGFAPYARLLDTRARSAGLAQGAAAAAPPDHAAAG